MMKCAYDLEIDLTSTQSRDLDGFMLTEEMDSLKPAILQSIQNDPLHILQFLAAMKRSIHFQFCVIALRIRLTIPVTVTSQERSNSKLKLIKTPLINHATGSSYELGYCVK